MTQEIEPTVETVGNKSAWMNWSIVFRVIFVVLALYTFLITAWVGDDALITFRQIWNFLNGAGITFNFEDRIQSFTHPLWFVFLSSVVFFTNELFVTSIVTNIVFSMLAIIVLLAIERRAFNENLPKLSPIFLLIFSWAVCDFATSGLENALTYFLVSILIGFLSKQDWKRYIKSIYTILALLVLNRFDYSLLFLPLCLTLVPIARRHGGLLKAFWLGVLLLSCWIVFATFYFGSPLPNSYFAKLSTNYPFFDKIEQGGIYFSALKLDLVSILIIVFAAVVSIASKNGILISLVVGQFFYFLYILFIGGDFMQGRFFAVPVFLSIAQVILAITLSKNVLNVYSKGNSLVLAIAAIIGLFTNYPFLSETDYKARDKVGKIVDERGFYNSSYGLFSNTRQGWPSISKPKNSLPKNYRFTCGFVGGFSLMEVDYVTIDICALTDPFLARLPAVQMKHWRIGHHIRKVPMEYGEYVIGNLNELPDKKLNDLLSDVFLVTRGSLFSFERFSAIARLNFNDYSDIPFSEYTDQDRFIPATNKIELQTLDSWEQEIGLEAFPPPIHVHSRRFNGNLKIVSRKAKLASKIILVTDSRNSYDIFINGEKKGNTIFDDQLHRKTFVLELEQATQISTIMLKATDVSYESRYLPEHNIIESVILE